jgi:hypothetical protein
MMYPRKENYLKTTSPSKRKTPYNTVILRFDTMTKLRELAAREKKSISATLSLLVANQYDTVFPETRKESNAKSQYSNYA